MPRRFAYFARHCAVNHRVVARRCLSFLKFHKLTGHDYDTGSWLRIIIGRCRYIYVFSTLLSFFSVWWLAYIAWERDCIFLLHYRRKSHYRSPPKRLFFDLLPFIFDFIFSYSHMPFLLAHDITTVTPKSCFHSIAATSPPRRLMSRHFTKMPIFDFGQEVFHCFRHSHGQQSASPFTSPQQLTTRTHG